MTEIEFLKKYESEKHLFEAWGNFVSKKIVEALNSNGIDGSRFLKINALTRLKAPNSLIAKAFYRNKNYKNPYDDITDKVGIRFVVLLDEDVQKLCSIIEDISEWTHSKDRDYESERVDEPLSFNYQSMHYIVKSKNSIDFQDVTIPSNIPCEIQVRTLLQHAYSELTHDRVYKTPFDPTSEIKRTLAKSMALLETTDEYFEKISNLMLNLPIFKLYNQLREKFSTINPEFEDGSKVNIHILGAYCNFINSHNFSDSNIFNEFDEVVKLNIDKTYLNNQPVIYFIYYMCSRYKNIFKKNWIYTREELRPYFTHLGASLD